MAEVLMIRNLDENAVTILDLVKKKHKISTNSKATLKIFDEYMRLSAKVDEQEKNIRKLSQKVEDQNEVLRTVQRTFDLLAKLK